jgi:hypothetical protein
MIIHQPHHPRRLTLGRLAALGGVRLASSLGRTLDDAYHYLPQIALPGAAAADRPIDAVVVGPGGTWVVTHAAERGSFRRRNGHWYRWNRSTESWVPWDAREIVETRLAARRLETYLERAALPSRVEPLLLAAAGAVIEWEPGERPGMGVEQEPARLAARIAREERLTPQQVDRIVALLDPRQPLPRLATSPQG